MAVEHELSRLCGQEWLCLSHATLLVDPLREPFHAASRLGVDAEQIHSINQDCASKLPVHDGDLEANAYEVGTRHLELHQKNSLLHA